MSIRAPSPAPTVVGEHPVVPIKAGKGEGEGKEAVPDVSPVSPAAPMLTDDEARLASMPKGAQLYLVMLGLLLGVYVVALDQTIVVPAIPSNDFDALADVGWYGSAYFMTSTALQPFYGRLYRMDLKWPFISCIVIFEIGSIICATAHNSKTFIVGRSIAGVGVAGGYIGVLTIVAASVPLNKVPMWSGAVGAIYGIGAITGPLIGGVFTSEVTWRWCFWLSLPLGGLTIAIMLLFFRPGKRPRPEGTTFQMIVRLDLLGTALVIAAVVAFLLALQDGGLQYALLVGFGVIVIAFLVNEYFMGDDAIIPLCILTSRTIAFASIANFATGASRFSLTIFLPICFQLLGSSSIRSGIQLLPLVCGVILSTSVSGGVAPRVGYVQPFLYIGGALGVTAAGLFQLFNEHTKQPLWTLGGTLFIAVSQSVYVNIFKMQIEALTISGLHQARIIASGTTGFRSFVPASILEPVIHAAMFAIRRAFIPACVFMGVVMLATIGLPYASIKGKTRKA
ncbi:MAG: hypothetical protein CYPHOPRED_002732 [Cyphobasidiales sp. Tagirdzhanova-0007]|nr:MAG: hypothetical protein CYPHOPRED_002732 [Cyphobasidiales sp. Tagirdzhanova-0007]